jgi:hypothetical protein
MTTLHWRLLLAWAATAVLLAPPARAQDVSAAEKLLFQTNHLQNVHAPTTLTYTFHKEGSAEPGFDDQVRLVLADGKPAATLVFLTGPRQYTAPAVDDPEGNPVLLGFLEHDITGMQRLTGGSPAYFRKRIRLALAEAAQVHPRQFTYAGKRIDGSEIVIVPYQNDPMHVRFEQFTGKRYTFVVSPQVPGGIYQVRAAADGAKGQPVLIDETLTLAAAGNGGR